MFCCHVDDFKPSTVDESYSQSVLPKPRAVKASASSLDLVMPDSNSNLTKALMAPEDSALSSSSAAFRPFRPQLPATTCEVVSQSSVLLSQSVPWSLQSGQSTVKLSTTSLTSQTNGDAKSTVASLLGSNSISAVSTPVVAGLMLHPTVSSFQLVSAIPAAQLASAASRAQVQPVQYIVPPLALSDTGGKIMQMLPTGTSQSGTQQLAGFQFTALPRAAIQLGSGGPQVLMLCQQSQAQHAQQQQQQHTSSLSSVLPAVMVAAGNSQQLAASK